MNKTLRLSAAIFFATAAAAQTRIAPSNLGSVPTGGVVAVIDSTGRFAFARLEGVELVSVNGSLVLRALAAQVRDRLVVAKITDAAAPIALPSAPASADSVQVARNGQVLSPGEDYTLAGQALTFNAAHAPRLGDIYQLRYREQ